MKKKTKIAPKKSGMYIVLDGHVYIETRTGKKVDREEIDGKIVLQVLNNAITEGVRLYKDNLEKP